MNVCLIEPSKFVSLTNFASTICMPPIGIAYIAAAIREGGHVVSVVDSPGCAPRDFFQFDEIRVRGLTNDKIIERIPEDAEVIGLSCMFSSQWVYVRELLREIRQRFPDAFLVMGGEHVTGFPDLTMEEAPLDAVVMGEGEETVVYLLHHLQEGQPLHDVDGLAYRSAEGHIITNPRRARIRNIDDIAPPAWDLFDIAAYQSVNQPHGASQGKFMPMLATRGCPFSCTFCTSPVMWTTRWIPRSPKLLVDEMVRYMERYGATDFQFEDLTAIVQKKWVGEFCDEIINRGLKITFQLPSGTRSEAIDYEIAVKMKKAGCHDFS
ncbi:MAG: B12-binding domain-containing radical SAM protein, partial [Magnetococcales bacterium]|nr:B12-binding domain-containing radical SAM protein [Magnetococcales bacterium]